MYKIAIVDDYTLIREAFTDMFQKLGMDVLFTACNGKEVQTRLLNDPSLPDIIFMDINMPVMDGITATAFIAAHFPSIKVIALSGFCNEKHVIDMLKNGARGFITKDAGKEEVGHAITTIMKDEKYIPAKIISEQKIPAKYLKSNNNKKYKTKLLNDREYEFLGYCATDLGYKEIACEMGVHYKTIDTYRASVAQKLKIRTRAGLAVYAAINGFIKNGIEWKNHG